MNKRISLIFAGLAVTAALAGCGSKTPAVTASESAKAHALATSSQAQAAESAAANVAATCIPSKDMNKAYFINLAFHKDQLKALEAKCKIPKGNIKPFLIAAAQSLASADPKTSAAKKTWETVTLPKIVEQYQKKS
jgi:predicted small lipoprotein YifL